MTISKNMNAICAIKSFKCEFCENEFRLETSLSTHVSDKHDPNKTYKCNICRFSYETLNQLHKHHRKHIHNSEMNTKIKSSD